MNPPPGQPPVDPRGVLRPPGYPPMNYGPPGAPMPPGARPMPPMPPMMPPPWMMAVPRQSGPGKGIAIAMLSIVLLISLVMNFVLVLIVALSAGPEPGQSQQQVITEGDSSQGIAVIGVHGVLFDNVEQQFRDDLEMAEEDSDIKAIIVHIDSPGGTVTDSHQMYEALRLFRQRSGKPVVVHMDSVAASGGYFVACAADEIVAEESTITGSIGVLMSYPELSEFAEKTGIRYRTLVADGSPRKNALDMWQKPSEEDLSEIANLLNQQHELFRSVVEAGRGEALASRGTELAKVTNGEVWLGREAQTLGLVDTLGFFDDAVNSAARLAGLSRPNVIRYTREPTLAELFGLAQTPLDGVKVNLSALESKDLKRAAGELLHELATPHSLYLYRGVQ